MHSDPSIKKLGPCRLSPDNSYLDKAAAWGVTAMRSSYRGRKQIGETYGVCPRRHSKRRLLVDPKGFRVESMPVALSTDHARFCRVRDVARFEELRKVYHSFKQRSTESEPDVSARGVNRKQLPSTRSCGKHLDIGLERLGCLVSLHHPLHQDS